MWYNNNNLSHHRLGPPTSGLAAPLAPPEETGEVARLEAVHQRALAHPALPEQLDLDPGHGLRGGRDILDIMDIICRYCKYYRYLYLRGGDQLLDVLLRAAVAPQCLQQVAQVRVALRRYCRYSIYMYVDIL